MWCRRFPVNANTSITFITPVTTLNIAPTLIDDTSPGISWRGAVVTDLIQASGNGFYTCGNFPVTQMPNNANFVTTNWTLAVIYRNASLPVRYFNLNTGALSVTNVAPANFTFSGFATPSSGPIRGYFFYTASNGDLLDGGQLRVGPTSPPASLLGNTSNPYNGLSPYNRVNNMLPAAVCNADGNSPNIGLLDTSGTYGTRNVDPYTLPTMPAFGRQIYDLAGIDMSSTLLNNQSTLNTRISFTSGGASVHAEAVQIDATAPSIVPLKTVDKAFAGVGNNLTYTVSFTNNGLANADDVVFFDTIPNSTSFVAGSVFINNVNFPSANPAPPGISIGTVSINNTLTISFNVVITSIPNPATLVNNSQVTYTYISIVSLPRLSGSAMSNFVTTTVSSANLGNISKSVDKAFIGCGGILTYTISIPNTGNTTALNVVFIDTIPNGTTLVSGSVLINGVTQIGDDPESGINLNSIPAGSTTTVSFKVTISC